MLSTGLMLEKCLKLMGHRHKVAVLVETKDGD